MIEDFNKSVFQTQQDCSTCEPTKTMAAYKKLKPDGVLALRERSGHGLPSLTKKLSAIDIH